MLRFLSGAAIVSRHGLWAWVPCGLLLSCLAHRSGRDSSVSLTTSHVALRSGRTGNAPNPRRPQRSSRPSRATPNIRSGQDRAVECVRNIPSKCEQLLIAQSNFDKTRLCRRFLRPNNRLGWNGTKTITSLWIMDRQKRTSDPITEQHLTSRKFREHSNFSASENFSQPYLHEYNKLICTDA